MYDLIIIGGGPAGITAAIYAKRQKLNILIITKEFGGQIAKKSVDIENYTGFEKISGPDLIEKFVSHLKSQDASVKKEKVIKVEKKEEGFSVITENNKFQAKTVIIASGSVPKKLGVPGEEEFTGKGVSYCALCDGPVFKNKTVAVIGGGNAGFESAVFLSNYVKKIYIMECGPEIKADKENQEMVEKFRKAEIITGVKIKEIKGDKFVNALIYQDLKTQKIKTLEVQAVFIEIGYQPAVYFIDKQLVDFSEKGEIKTDLETCQTKTKGLFAAGDVSSGKHKQIITAAAEGAKAALSAYEYIKK